MTTQPQPPDPASQTMKSKEEEVLSLATTVLISRVGVLATAVERNNDLILDMRHEVNKKPDDGELKWMMTENKRIRTRLLTVVILPAIVASAVVAAGASYLTSEHDSRLRCISNRQSTENLITIFGTFQTKVPDKRISNAIKTLQEEKVNCR